MAVDTSSAHMAGYRTAKAAATTAILHGISSEDFRRHYLPVCEAISSDNRIGKFIYALNDWLFSLRFARRGVLRMVLVDQRRAGLDRPMSTVLWDIFTGSAPYRILQAMSRRIRVLDAKVAQMKVRGGVDESGVRIVSTPATDLMKLYEEGQKKSKRNDRPRQHKD